MVQINTEAMKIGLDKKSTEELIEIWKKNDQYSWTEEAFEVVKELLEERNTEVPEQDAVSDEPIKKNNPENSEIKYGIACIIGGILVYVVSMNSGDYYILPHGIILVGIFILIKHRIL